MSLSSRALLYRCWNQPLDSLKTMMRQCCTIGESKMRTLINQDLEQQYQSLPATLRRIFSRKGVVMVDYHSNPYYG